MRMPLRKRSVAKVLEGDKSTPTTDMVAAAERTAKSDKRRAVPHKDAMAWLRQAGVRKRRTAPPWK